MTSSAAICLLGVTVIMHAHAQPEETGATLLVGCQRSRVVPGNARVKQNWTASMLLAAWYDNHTEAPITVTTAAELDVVLEEVATAGPLQMAQLITNGDIHEPHLFVGLNGDRGTLRYSSNDAGILYSRNTGVPFALPDWGAVIYYFERADFQYPDDSEIPVDEVRQAAHDFLASGGARPGGVTWAREERPAIDRTTP
ncbi:Imm1 family immunity protein [Actinomycetes bacterium KLBMP 9759]